MAENVGQRGALQGRRLRSLVVPREHGAWGMLLVPLVTGAAVGLMEGRQVIPLLLLVVVALALFWMRTPVESWLGTSPLRAQTEAERRAVVIYSFALAAVAGVALTALLWGGRNSKLFLLGAVAGAAFVAQTILKKLSRKLRMAAQVVGSLGLTATAPAAYYVVTGQLDSRAWALWLANWLFAGDQIHFVQLRIHSARVSGWSEKLARGRGFLLGQIALAAVLLIAWRSGALPGLALVAFVPVFLRGTAWFAKRPEPLAVHRLGWTELAHAIAFGLLLILGFQGGR